MKLLIRGPLRITAIFIFFEILLCIASIYLIDEHLFLRDMLVGALLYVMAAILPVWILGFIHLRSIGLLCYYKRACVISFGWMLVLLMLSIIWTHLFKYALLVPVVTFNIAGLIQVYDPVNEDSL